MSVKHIKEYYNQVVSDYHSMKQDLADMEKELADKLVSPEQLEQLRLLAAPVTQNYETLSYYMYLLNQPNKSVKQDRYKKAHKHLVEAAGSRTKQGVLAENQQSKQGLKELKEDLLGE